jgi:hypothetical protein
MEIYISCFQSNHVPGILTTSLKHWARHLRSWSAQAHSLCTSLPHYKLLIRWCSCGVSRSEHGAKVHDKHEEHRISHQTTPRQKTINVRTRSTTKTPRQHAVQQLLIWSAPPGKGCVKVFLTFTRDLDDAGTLRPLQIRKSWCSRRHLVESLKRNTSGGHCRTAPLELFRDMRLREAEMLRKQISTVARGS